jgi:hypothetical protein
MSLNEQGPSHKLRFGTPSRPPENGMKIRESYLWPSHLSETPRASKALGRNVPRHDGVRSRSWSRRSLRWSGWPGAINFHIMLIPQPRSGASNSRGPSSAAWIFWFRYWWTRSRRRRSTISANGCQACQAGAIGCARSCQVQPPRSWHTPRQWRSAQSVAYFGREVP